LASIAAKYFVLGQYLKPLRSSDSSTEAYMRKMLEVNSVLRKRGVLAGERSLIKIESDEHVGERYMSIILDPDMKDIINRNVLLIFVERMKVKVRTFIRNKSLNRSGSPHERLLPFDDMFVYEVIGKIKFHIEVMCQHCKSINCRDLILYRSEYFVSPIESLKNVMGLPVFWTFTLQMSREMLWFLKYSESSTSLEVTSFAELVEDIVPVIDKECMISDCSVLERYLYTEANEGERSMMTHIEVLSIAGVLALVPWITIFWRDVVDRSEEWLSSIITVEARGALGLYAMHSIVGSLGVMSFS
jgi:hypothetical protein